MLKRYGVLLICLLFIISTLTGCFQGSALGKPKEDAAAVISVWYSLQGKEEQELLKQLKRISIENNEVVVKGEKIAESTFVDYVWKMQAGGLGPDILIASRKSIVDLYEEGAISPVLAETDQPYASAEALFTFNQERYAAPWLTDVPLLYYRIDEYDEAPKDLNEILAKRSAIATSSLNTALLGPWWKAEGGILSSAGLPRIDFSINHSFIERMLYLTGQGLLIHDNQALQRLARGEVNYAIAWASQRHVLDKAKVNWDCRSLETVLGKNGKALLDKTIGIANSSIKTIPGRESAILIVQEELLKTEVQTAMFETGYRIPVSQEYYTTLPSTFNRETAKTIDNAWILAGDLIDWYYIAIQDVSWRNIFAGADVEDELEKAQQSAFGLLEQ